jgi:hypothetical protein
MKSLLEIAQDAYVRQRVSKRTRKDKTPTPDVPDLPPFSLGVKGKRQRKDVIRSKIRKTTRLTKRHKFFQECVSNTTNTVPFPVMIELGKLASSLYSLDDDDLNRLHSNFERLGKSYFKIGQWDQNEYEEGTGKGNIYAVIRDNDENPLAEDTYLVVCDFEENFICSIPFDFYDRWLKNL